MSRTWAVRHILPPGSLLAPEQDRSGHRAGGPLPMAQPLRVGRCHPGGCHCALRAEARFIPECVECLWGPDSASSSPFLQQLYSNAGVTPTVQMGRWGRQGGGS